MENEDFQLVPAEAWHLLQSWYGLVDGQPPLERKVLVAHVHTQDVDSIKLGVQLRVCALCAFEVVDLPSTLKVEVYPVEIFLCLHSNMDHVVSRQFSRADTICECVCVRASCKVCVSLSVSS